MDAQTSYRQGFIAAVAAFTMWGVLPLYLKPLHDINAITIIAHRLTWGFVCVIAWLALRGQLSGVLAALRQPRLLAGLAGTATLISLNWLIYVWAIGHEHVIDTSLGYFINPLVNVLLGVALLSERLNQRQWIAVGIAGLAVVWLAVHAGRLPWISLALAVSFSAYGLARKLLQVDSVTGLAVETLLLLPFGIGWMIWVELHGGGAFGGQGAGMAAWLMLGGIATALPLALFAFGAQRIPYSTVGIIQYIGPSLQLVIGLLVFREAFPPERIVGFALIWVSLAIYAADGLWRMRRLNPATAV